MTEERSCKTCRFHFGNSKLGVICGNKFIGACNSFDKWQPIQKAPSFQMTDEEAREIIKHVCIRASVNYKWIEIVDVDTTISELRKRGYIRKSSLVELVKEAEELWSACYHNTELEPSNLNAKLYEALQALKKIIKSSEVRNDNKK